MEIANRFDLRSNRGNVVATPRHRALVSGVYQLPFGAGRAWAKPGFLNAVFGGWDASTVMTMQTGQWLTPTISSAYDQSNTGRLCDPAAARFSVRTAAPEIPTMVAQGVFYNIPAPSNLIARDAA